MRCPRLIGATLLALATAALVGCGGGGSSAADAANTSTSSGTVAGTGTGGTSSTSASVPPPVNVIPVTVGSGPTSATSNVNIPYVTLTVCAPGTSQCTTIDHVLLDTGSWGLRLMASVLSSTGVTLINETDTTGNYIGECTPFAAGYASGLVALADVTLGGETATGLPVQIVDDSNASAGPATALPCSGRSLNSVAAFNANAVLGVGVFAYDCGTGCAQVTNNGVYFKCTTSLVCSSTAVPLAGQVTNPVARFSDDNNGVIVSLPAVADGGTGSTTGTLTFGIGTQSNNPLGSATVLPVDKLTGRMVVLYGGRTFTDAFIDSGSNSINFADSGITQCSGGSGFYCPTSTLSLSAINQGTNGTQSAVSFLVANFQTLRQTNRNAYSYDDIAGTTGANTFDWGLPFYYGRTIYTAIEGRSTPGGPGPYFAY